MITRVTFQMMLLPVLIVALPLMFTLAWLQEIIDDLKPRPVSR
jgi:hypothetical protein